jgi:hypothetical protein
MPGQVLNCDEARLQIAGYLEGSPCPALSEHLSRCEPCLEICVQASLQRPSDVRVPGNFGQRLLARLPEAPPAEIHERLWGALVAAIVAAMVAVALWRSGEISFIAAPVADALRRPAVLLAVGATETTPCLLWLWRIWRECR